MNRTQRLTLDGLRVVITRAETQSGELRSELESRGALILSLPAIEIQPVSSADIDALLTRLSFYDWIVFTSANAVRVIFSRTRSDQAGDISAVRVAAVGPSTARQLSDRNIRVDLIPERFQGEFLVQSLVAAGVEKQRVLVPCSEIARDTVAEGLMAAGAIVDVVPVYRTVKPDAGDPKVVEFVRSGQVDVIIFASPSAVRNTMEMIGGELKTNIVIACIGSVTADQAHRLGLRIDVQPVEPSVRGLVEAISDFWEQRGKREFIDV